MTWRSNFFATTSLFNLSSNIHLANIAIFQLPNSRTNQILIVPLSLVLLSPQALPTSIFHYQNSTNLLRHLVIKIFMKCIPGLWVTNHSCIIVILLTLKKVHHPAASLTQWGSNLRIVQYIDRRYWRDRPYIIVLKFPNLIQIELVHCSPGISICHFPVFLVTTKN